MFVALTNEDGERVYVNITLVQWIVPFDAQRWESHERQCRSQLSSGPTYYRVRETVDEIIALVEQARQTPETP